MTASDFAGRTLRAFSEDLASAGPTPGGGSAAAYAGALGAALNGMVARIATRKADSPRLQAFVAETDALRLEFLRLIDADCDAYGDVAQAMKLPRATDQEKAARTERLQTALVSASRVPLEIAAASRRLLDACERAVEMAGPSTVSDVGVGALLAEACLRGAALNVMVNLASLKDAERVKELSEELDRSLEGAEAQRRRVTDFVESRIAR